MEHISKELLYKYIDKETTNAQNIEIKAHIEQCEQCKKQYEQLSIFISNINNLPIIDMNLNLLKNIKHEKTQFNISVLFSKFSYITLVISIIIGLFIGHLLINIDNRSLDLPEITSLYDFPENSITGIFFDIQENNFHQDK